MKSTNTGDHSGGLDRKDGSSTPPRNGSERVGPDGKQAREEGSHTSDEVAESTQNKNAPGAFLQQANAGREADGV